MFLKNIISKIVPSERDMTIASAKELAEVIIDQYDVEEQTEVLKHLNKQIRIHKEQQIENTKNYLIRLETDLNNL